MTTLKINADDAAIVIRADGTFETSFPNIDDENIPEHIELGAALAFAIQDAKLCQKIFENFYKVCEAK